MMTMLKRSFIAVAVLLTAAASFAQTALTTTTLAAAVAVTDQFVQVASATNITNPGTGATLVYLLVDKEFMQVRTGVSGTVVPVVRGAFSTRAASHVSGAAVTVVPPAAAVQFIPSGQCQRTTLSYVPQVIRPESGLNTDTGSMYDCLGVGANGQWVQTYPSLANIVIGSTVASAASITPTGTYFQVSGTTAISTIVVPAGWGSGMCLILEPTGLFTTTTGGNISLGSTAVVGKMLTECWNGATSKWQPSY